MEDKDSIIRNGRQKLDEEPCTSNELGTRRVLGVARQNGQSKVVAKKINAKRCWALIAESLIKKRRHDTSSSVSRSSSFEASTEYFTYSLYTTERLEEHTKRGSWFRLKWPEFPTFRSFNVHIFDTEQVTTLDDIKGFNNTGNIRVWPSEECLAYYLLKNPSKIVNKSVLELGAGMTGLAGLIAANYASKVVLSDGNDKSVVNLEKIAARNDLKNVEIRKIRWEDDHSMTDLTFDIIIAADCLFFKEYHQGLSSCLDRFLDQDGEILIMAPERKGTLREFFSLVEEDHTFSYELIEDYDPTVMAKVKEQTDGKAGFIEDLHRVKLIVMKRVL